MYLFVLFKRKRSIKIKNPDILYNLFKNQLMLFTVSAIIFRPYNKISRNPHCNTINYILNGIFSHIFRNYQLY